MTKYRWLAYDLRTNVALEEVPLTGVRYGGVLGGSAPFSAAMSVPEDNAPLAAALVAATTPERTIIYPERNGVLIGDGGYIVWGRDLASEGPVRLTGAAVASILRRNRIVADLAFAAEDQFTIAQALVNHLQDDQPGGDVGIVVGTDTCGVDRDRTYWAYERKNIGDALAQLAAVDNGFEWAIDLAWSGDAEPVPTKTLNLSYPRRGRAVSATGLIFESGKNIVNYRLREDGTRSARSVDAIGGGDGSDMRISTATRTDLIDAGWPLTAATVAHKDVIEQDTLDGHALDAVTGRAATPTFWDVWVDADDPESGIGQWITGDEVRLHILDRHFPAGHSGTYRIVAWEAQPADDGPEVVQITLGPAAA
jgi:hypothetical protein